MSQHISTKGSTVCSQEFWYILSGLDIQLEQSENEDPAHKKLVQGCKTLRVTYSFSLARRLQTHGSVENASCSEHGNMNLSSTRCWNFFLPLGHFVWHWARQWNDTCAFYIAVCSLFFCSRIVWVWTLLWQGLPLNMNIWLPLFWTTWRPATSQDPDTCAGHCRLYVYYNV